jgi:cell division protein FtsB
VEASGRRLRGLAAAGCAVTAPQADRLESVVAREDELKAEIADLYDRLHRAQAELREIELAAMPFHTGDIAGFGFVLLQR